MILKSSRLFRTGLKYVFNLDPFKKMFYNNEKIFLNLVQVETLFWTCLKEIWTSTKLFWTVEERTRHQADF